MAENRYGSLGIWWISFWWGRQQVPTNHLWGSPVEIMAEWVSSREAPKMVVLISPAKPKKKVPQKRHPRREIGPFGQKCPSGVEEMQTKRGSIIFRNTQMSSFSDATQGCQKSPLLSLSGRTSLGPTDPVPRTRSLIRPHHPHL